MKIPLFSGYPMSCTYMYVCMYVMFLMCFDDFVYEYFIFEFACVGVCVVRTNVVIFLYILEVVM